MRPLAEKQFKAIMAGHCRENGIAFRFKVQLKQPSDTWIVVNDQDA